MQARALGCCALRLEGGMRLRLYVVQQGVLCTVVLRALQGERTRAEGVGHSWVKRRRSGASCK